MRSKRINNKYFNGLLLLEFTLLFITQNSNRDERYHIHRIVLTEDGKKI